MCVLFAYWHFIRILGWGIDDIINDWFMCGVVAYWRRRIWGGRWSLRLVKDNIEETSWKIFNNMHALYSFGQVQFRIFMHIFFQKCCTTYTHSSPQLLLQVQQHLPCLPHNSTPQTEIIPWNLFPINCNTFVIQWHTQKHLCESFVNNCAQSGIVINWINMEIFELRSISVPVHVCQKL